MTTLIATLIIISFVCVTAVSVLFLFNIEKFISISAWLFYPYYFSILLIVLMSPFETLITISSVAAVVLSVVARFKLKAEVKKSAGNTVMEV